jgi:hypothetical protein
MGSLVFQATLGGQVNLNGPNTASTFDIAVPATTGTMVTTGDSGTVTNTMLAASAYNTPGTIGSGTANSGAFTTLSASSTVSGTGFSTYLASPPAIGGTTAAAGSFTTLAASSTVSGTGFSTYLASPPAIGGTAAAAGTFTTLSGTTSVTTPIVKSASSLTFQTNGTTTAVTVDTSQNVGIGTASPAYKLDVAGTTRVNNGVLSVQSTSGVTLPSSGYGWEIYNVDSSNNYLQSYNRTGSVYMNSVYNALSHQFYISGTERMRIDSNGRIQVNGTTIVDSARISVSADGANSTGVSIKALSTSCTLSTYWNTSNTTVGSITTNGTTVAYNITSDYRLKQNIAPMTGALAKVTALKPVTYKWISNGSDGEGFIAHELAEVCPNAVTGVKDAVDADGNPKYQGIDVSFLVATLTAAIQEQQALITSLTARIAALEAK